MSRDNLLSHFYEKPSLWGGALNTPCSSFAKGPRFLNMVMTFDLTPLSHYNTITEPRARFLLPLMKGLFIDFPSHIIAPTINIYRDITTCDKLVFPSTIMQILMHFFIPIHLSPLFTIIGVISAGSIRRSEAQLQSKRPRVETTDPIVPIVPPSFALTYSTPSSSAAGGVTLKAIMEQLQRMHADFSGRLDFLTNEMCQMNTRVGHIAHQQARMAGLTPSPSPSLEAFPNVNDDKDDADSSNDDEMTTSQ